MWDSKAMTTAKIKSLYNLQIIVRIHSAETLKYHMFLLDKFALQRKRKNIPFNVVNRPKTTPDTPVGLLIFISFLSSHVLHCNTGSRHIAAVFA